MPRLHHLTTRPAWGAALGPGVYSAPSLATEGFIHLSTARQLPLTAQRFYLHTPDLIVLDIDPGLVTAEIRWEEPIDADDPGSGDRFPHLYGALETAAVVGVRRVRFEDGRPVFSP